MTITYQISFPDSNIEPRFIEEALQKAMAELEIRNTTVSIAEPPKVLVVVNRGIAEVSTDGEVQVQVFDCDEGDGTLPTEFEELAQNHDIRYELI